MKHAAKLIRNLAATALICVTGCGLGPQDAAPQVQFVTLAGQKIATADLRGKVVLVNFWATSCEVCVHEMPMMVDTHRKFSARGYEMVAVAMSYDHPNLVAGYVQKNALPFTVALDLDGTIAKAWGNVSATPTSYLIDRRGRIIKRYVGEPTAAELHALIDKALADPV